MTTREIIATVIAAVVLTIDLITDYRLRLKYRDVVMMQGAVKHKQGFWIRAIGLTPAFILGWWALTPLIAFAYWHLFDGITNILWGNNWFRLGTTAGTDNFQRRYPWLTWVKYIGLAVFIFLFIMYKLGYAKFINNL